MLSLSLGIIIQVVENEIKITTQQENSYKCGVGLTLNSSVE
jgi:hypothetical protein